MNLPEQADGDPARLLRLLQIIHPDRGIYASSHHCATTGKVRKPVKGTTVAVALALVFVATAVASSANPAWTSKDMKAAIRAVGYPKPHPVKLGCKGLGTATSGAYTSFRCTASYRRHVRKRFFISGEGEGGWLCAGKSLADCKLLRHGFVTNTQVGHDGSVTFAAELASRGYMANHYNTPVPYVGHGCPTKTAPTYSFCYAASNNTTVAVNITMKRVKGGYTFTGNSTVQPAT